MALLSNGLRPSSPQVGGRGGRGPFLFMDAKAAEDPKLLAHYEGLVRKTAGRVAPRVEEEYEDICQFLRYKTWRALLSVDPAQLRKRALKSEYTALQLRDRYVFSCIANAVKDVLKRKRHNLLFIDDLMVSGNSFGEFESGDGSGASQSNDAFFHRYLREEDFTEVLGDVALVPSTLTPVEREVLLLMYMDYKPAEIAEQAEVPPREVTAAIKSIKEKMADWAPAGSAPVPIAA